MIYNIHNEQEMLEFAKEYARTLTGGDVVLLSGNLGSGKTTFTKGIALGLGIFDDVTSPTFTIMQVYPISDNPSYNQLVHIDTYRVHDEEELKNIGVQDYIGDSQSITIIEWPDKLKELIINKNLKKIEISHTKNNAGRTVEVSKEK